MLRAAVMVMLVAVIATWSISVSAPRAHASDTHAVVAANADDISTEINGAWQASDEDDDTSMRVVLWTVLAAGIAAGVGLVLYMVRVILGRVQPPTPEQREQAHH